MPVQFLGQEDRLEKEMATHSSILAQRIPWTEERGGLLSIESKESYMTEATYRMKRRMCSIASSHWGLGQLAVLGSTVQTTIWHFAASQYTSALCLQVARAPFGPFPLPCPQEASLKRVGISPKSKKGLRVGARLAWLGQMVSQNICA